MVIALCALFMVIPAVGAVESSDTGNTVVTNTIADQDLKIGMTGENVTQLQTWLKNQGFYTGTIDSQYGNYTEQAVKAFQQYMGIKEDGIVGPITRQAMDNLINGNIISGSCSKAANGASNSYSNSYESSKNGWSNGRGVGDCWDNSYALASQLRAAGYTVRIVQYSNSYVSNHRSVQIYQNGQWVDYDYKSNGYSNRYYAQQNKPGMTVI